MIHIHYTHYGTYLPVPIIIKEVSNHLGHYHPDGNSKNKSYITYWPLTLSPNKSVWEKNLWRYKFFFLRTLHDCPVCVIFTKKSPITVAQPVFVRVYVYVCATLRNGRVGREKSKKRHVWEEKQLCWFWRAYNITHTRTPFPFFTLSHFLCVCPIAIWFCGWTQFFAMISF